MNLTDAEKDKFVAETALRKGVDVDKLLEMHADSYTGILKNADELLLQAKREQYADMFKDGYMMM